MKRFRDLIYNPQARLNLIKIINFYYKIQQKILKITDIRPFKYFIIPRSLIS